VEVGGVIHEDDKATAADGFTHLRLMRNPDYNTGVLGRSRSLLAIGLVVLGVGLVWKWRSSNRCFPKHAGFLNIRDSELEVMNRMLEFIFTGRTRHFFCG
jgi:hypothetical protein